MQPSEEERYHRELQGQNLMMAQAMQARAATAAATAAAAGAEAERQAVVADGAGGGMRFEEARIEVGTLELARDDAVVDLPDLSLALSAVVSVSGTCVATPKVNFNGRMYLVCAVTTGFGPDTQALVTTASGAWQATFPQSGGTSMRLHGPFAPHSAVKLYSSWSNQAGSSHDPSTWDDVVIRVGYHLL